MPLNFWWLQVAAAAGTGKAVAGKAAAAVPAEFYITLNFWWFQAIPFQSRLGLVAAQTTMGKTVSLEPFWPWAVGQVAAVPTA
jgi:hypothetical protein